MADDPIGEPDDKTEPNMLQQTMELATILKKIADRDPEGHPAPSAKKVFHEWLAVARNFTEEPQYFADVLENYDVEARSNKDLFDLFEMLHPYVEIVNDRPFPDEDIKPPAGGRTFINLPTL